MLILVLLARVHLFDLDLASAARFPRGEVAVATASAAVAAVAPIAPVIAIAVTITVASALALVAIGPAHHRRRPRLVLIDPHGEETDDVGRKPHLTLELVHRIMRGIDVHQRVVRLAVLLDAERERFQAPIFGLGDRPAAALKQGAKVL